MRSVLIRLAAVAAGVLVVASCDSRLPTSAVVAGSGSSGSTSNGPGVPTVSIDSPQVNALINVSDSILVVLRLHDDKGLASATVTGVSYSGSADLGTLAERVRFSSAAIPVNGKFRDGLKDTVIRRYLKNSNAADTSLDSLVLKAIVKDGTGSSDTATKRVQLVAGPRVSIT